MFKLTYLGTIILSVKLDKRVVLVKIVHIRVIALARLCIQGDKK
jgi:hypothetical protein